MSELNWQRLRVDMLKNGIAPKYVRRTILELLAHFEELKRQALKDGLPEPEASDRARREIGDEGTILREVMNKPELRSLQSRFPRSSFLLIPSLTLVAGFALVILSILYLANSVSDPVSGAEVVGWQRAVVNLWFILNCYLLTPLLAVLTVVAARERLIPPLWPALGILLMAVLGCGWAYSIVWPASGSEGSINLNWGYSFLPRMIRGDHDIQNYVKILTTLAAAFACWKIYNPVDKDITKSI